MEKGTWTGGSNGSPVRRIDAIQHLDICAKLVSIIGRRICGDGSGCSIIMLIANSVIGLYSFGCGEYGNALQCIHVVDNR